MKFELVKSALEFLPEYKAALESNWSPDNVRGAVAVREELEKIATAPAAFVAQLDDPEAKGEPIKLPDGSIVPRLPGFRRWMWDDGFCGSIGLRWQKGNIGASTSCAGPHRLYGGAVEARPQLRQARLGADADRGPGARG